MGPSENFKVVGKLTIDLFDEAGALKASKTVDNLVVTAGLGFITSRMTGTSSAVMSHMAVGTSATTPARADTALGAEVGRVALASATVSTVTYTNDSIIYIATFGAGVGTGALTEAGVLNASSAGTLLCHTTFATVNKTSTDTMSITWTVTVN
jgi:hypothetical protein